MLKVIYANAELRLALHEIMVGAQYRLAELVSHRWGMQAGRDPRPHALAQVAVSLFQETTQWWANDPSKTLQETAEAVCDVALRGERSLAQPPAPRTPLT